MGKEIHEEWNVNWLGAEHHLSEASVQSASAWQVYVKEKETLPYLTYRTVGDSNVRDSHAKLHGITLPVDHSFWDTHKSPNGFRCRCWEIQTDDKSKVTKEKDLKNLPELPKVFRNNPGKTGKVFNEHHPYYQSVSKEGKANIDKLLKGEEKGGGNN